MGECNITIIHDRAKTLEGNLRTLRADIHDILFGCPIDESEKALDTSSCLTGVDQELINCVSVLQEIFKTLESVKSNPKVG